MPTAASESFILSHALRVPPETLNFAEQAIVLEAIEWHQYTALRDPPANRGLRMTFADGRLEIMTLSGSHELISMLIDHFILVWRIERNIPVRPSGSMTLRRPALLRGLESDQSYYIQHAAQVRSMEHIDLEVVAPPDLAVEVEHTSAAVQKMPIYAALTLRHTVNETTLARDFKHSLESSK